MDDPTPTRRRRRRRPHEKLTLLTAAGAEVFEREGYTRAHVEAICKAAGVGVGTFYDHFGNKAELLLHLAEMAYESARLPPTHDRAALEEGVRWLTTFPAAPLSRTWLEAIRVDPALAGEHLRMRETRLAECVRWVRGSRARRGRQSSLTDQGTARVALALLKEAVLGYDDPSGERVRELATAIWILLYGDSDAR